MLQTRYLRACRLQVASAPGTAMEFRTRIRFKINKDSTSLSNKSQIEIYNLNDDSISFIQKDNCTAILYAGYGSYDQIIFTGDIILPLKKERRGSDKITHIELGDGEKTLSQSTLDISVKKGASLESLLDKAISSMNNITTGALRFENVDLSSALSYSGSSRDFLNMMSKDYGFQWQITDGALNIYPDADQIQTRAVVLTSKTGLIEAQKSDKNIVGKALLNPGISPGRPVDIRGLEVNSTCTIKEVHHEGDSVQGPWFTNFIGEPRL